MPEFPHMTPKTRVDVLPPINWPATLMFIITGLAAVTLVPWYALTFEVSAGAWILAVVLLAITKLSITAGYHRLWAHRTYSAHWSVRLFYMVFGSMAIQNSVFEWASGHRKHHINVDDVDLDPYSAKRGFWFSHIGWMIRKYPSGINDFANIKDLERDPILAFQARHYLKIAVGTNVGITALAGWAIGDFWGAMMVAGVLRLVVSQHFTFFINSLAHMWGSRPYTDSNTARDNGILAFVTFGEGYHNFHHYFAHDYRNAIRWWQWDPTKWLIATLGSMGLARNLKRVPRVQIQRAVMEMQFKRAEARLVKARAAAPVLVNIEEVRARLAHEYASFKAALAEWTRVKDAWYESKKRALLQRLELEEANFVAQLREIERGLKLQAKRLRVLHAELA